MTVSERLQMPSLGGATEWLNSEPLAPAELRGHVVLVDFWTLTCINWLRQEPYIRAWSQAYQNDGLVVIGVHTPEFSFEHDIARVRQATKDRAIDYPVAVDNDYEIWSAFANHYWPASYFVDAEGFIRDHHFGEGRYERSERVIQRLLRVERQLVPVEGVGVEADADWNHLDTPETYLGYERTEHFASPAGAVVRPPRRLRDPRAPALQPLGARRRVDDRARACRTRPGRREHRLPVPRARRSSCAVSRIARANSLPRSPRWRGSGPVTRRGRRPGRARRAPGRPPVPTRARAQRGAREDAEDHVPRARRRGVRVHLRLARVTHPIKLCKLADGLRTALITPRPSLLAVLTARHERWSRRISVAQVDGFTLRATRSVLSRHGDNMNLPGVPPAHA